MANRPAFGRARPLQEQRTVRTPDPAPGPKAPPPIERFVTAPPQPPGTVSVDEELRAWKEGRQRLPFPWRQVSLMASLCFGIASFVLPDSVNAAVDWLLYGLTGASLLGGVFGWRKKA